MPKFLIERSLPGAGKMAPSELQGIASTSNDVLAKMAGRANWLQSYVLDDAIVCVYVAEDGDAVLEHARAGGFPCDDVRQVRTVIDPVTAEG
jgi:hypothetical protein